MRAEVRKVQKGSRSTRLTEGCHKATCHRPAVVTCGGDPGAVGCDPGMCCDVVGGAVESRRAPHPQRKP